MYDFRARCQTTFWQLKTLQLCLDLVSCSSGLDSGAFVLNSKARCQVWGVWRAWLSWGWALPYLLHTTDLDFKWTWVREEQEKVIWQYLIAGWAYCLHSALIWGWRAPWKTGRARKLENDKKTKLYSSKTGEAAAAHMMEAPGCPTPTASSPSQDRPTSSLRQWPCHRWWLPSLHVRLLILDNWICFFLGDCCCFFIILWEMLFLWSPQLRDIDHFCKDTESHLHNPLLANRCFIVHLVLKMCDKMAKICFFSF